MDNEAIFAMLESADGREAVDAINLWTRAQMWLPFTRQPKRGFIARILPAIPVMPGSWWLRMGVSDSELERLPEEADDIPVDDALCIWEYETGDLFYEVAEDKIDNDDYLARLAARQVSKFEWRWRARRARRHIEDRWPDACRRKFYTIMNHLIGGILLHRGKEPA